MIPIPLLKRIRIVWNQDCVASAPKLMSFDPSPDELNRYTESSQKIFEKLFQ